jgi:glycine oxidase
LIECRHSSHEASQVSKHIVVIGAGIAGLAAAWQLARRGARVEILERGEAGQESSWAGAGILSLLLPWNYAAPVNALTELSLAKYPDWIDAIRASTAIDPEFRRTGMLVRAPYDTTSAASWLASHPVTPQPAELAPFGNGLWLPEVAQVRNPRLLQALLDSLQHQGIVLHSNTGPIRIETRANRVSVAISDERRWQADQFVVAAGAWSAVLLGSDADDLPIRPIRGQILLYKAAPGRLPCVLYEAGRYLVPRADGHILAGSTLEDVGFDKRTTGTAYDHLHEFVQRMLPDVAAAGPIRHWAGLRPGSPDNIPIIARHPVLENLFVNSGHFRYGVTLAPASAELLADLMEDKIPELAPRLFDWPDIIRAAPV